MNALLFSTSWFPETFLYLNRTDRFWIMMDLVEFMEFLCGESGTKVVVFFFEQADDLCSFFFRQLIVRGFSPLFVNERGGAECDDGLFQAGDVPLCELQELCRMDARDLFANASLDHVMAINVLFGHREKLVGHI